MPKFERQVVDIPLSLGVDTKTDPKQAKGLLRAENGVVRRSGSIEKVPGRRELTRRVNDTGDSSILTRSAAGRLVQGFTLTQRNGCPVVVGRDEVVNTNTGRPDGESGRGVFQLDGTGDWAPVSACSSSVGVRLSSRGKASLPNVEFPVVVWGDYEVHGFVDKDTSEGWFNVIERKTGRYVYRQLVDSGATFTVCRLTWAYRGSDNEPYIIGYYIEAGAAPGRNTYTVRWSPTDPSTAPVGSVTGLTNEVLPFAIDSIDGPFDGTTINDLKRASAILYVLSGTTDGEFRLVDGNGTQHGVTISLDTATYGGIASYAAVFAVKNYSGSVRWFVVYIDSANNLKSVVLDNTPSVVAGPTTIEATLAASELGDITGAGVPWSNDNTATPGPFIAWENVVEAAAGGRASFASQVFLRTLDWDGAAVDARETIYHARLAGSAFMHERDVYLPVSLTSGPNDVRQVLQDVILLLRLRHFGDDLGTPRAAVEARVGAPNAVARVFTSGGGTPKTHRVVGAPSVYALGASVWDGRREWDTVNSVFTAKLSGSVASFDLQPQRLPRTLLGLARILGGGNATFSDGLDYEVGYHRYPYIQSASAAAGTNPGAGTYSYKATYEWVDQDGELHRSESGPAISITLGGANEVDVVVETLGLSDFNRKEGDIKIVLWRTEAGGAVYYRATEAANDATALTVTIRDDVPDAVLTTGQQLYTNGGEIASICPPANVAMTATRNRVWLIDADDRTRLWFSKNKSPNIAVEFSDLLTLTIEPGGDFVTAAAIDDTLFAFKEGRTYVITGDGPNDLGQGQFFPRLLFPNLGATDPNGAVGYREGVFFKSPAGFYMIDRSLNANYIGAAVEGFNDRAVRRAFVVENLQQVRFVLEDGTRLIYDYYHRLWTVLPADEDGPRVVDSDVIGGTVYELASTGRVFRDDEEVPLGDAMRLSTAWLSFQDTQSFQRMWRVAILGEYRNDFTLRVREYVDYKETVVHEHLLPVQAGDTSVMFWPKVPRATTTRFDIEDVDGEGDYSLSVLSIEAAVQPQLNRRLPAKKRF